METVPNLRETLREAISQFNNRQMYLARHQLSPTEIKGLSNILLTAVQSHIQTVLTEEAEYIYENEEELRQLEQAYNTIKLLVDHMTTDREITFDLSTLDRYTDQFLAIEYDEIEKRYKVSVHLEDPDRTLA